MGKKAKIATFGLSHQGKETQQQMADFILGKIAALKNERPDLIVLPEGFLQMTGDRQDVDWTEPTERMLGALGALARELHAYIIAPLYESVPGYPDRRYNVTVLIDREGAVAGKYAKLHPVVTEMENSRVVPGTSLPVFDTDFGRIGVMCCFDIGWRAEWQRLAEAGAQLVVWVSAYDGGNLLNAYAALHMYYVVSSVRSSHAKIIDLTGRTVAESSIWSDLAISTVDLETTLFHIDLQSHKISDIIRDLGEKVTIRSYSQENVFTIESNDPEWPVPRIIERYGLITYKDYHADATQKQRECLEKYPMA